ncbi:hypothetical protein ElyMa_006588300 [Elysia marginata]|uniref:Uncharacterized protein n=1 Tax=Elysia marginata TaxID=1093978 RepID=A0AAV4IHP6_9GAST|nr:hypothetical protein ElyMa_006588300 [Elysia marginata]
MEGKVEEERRWIKGCYHNYEKPQEIPDSHRVDDLKEFESIIWKYPSEMMILQYDHTPGEMAVLCSSGSSGWLMSSQSDWILRKLNGHQKKTLNLNIVGNYCTKEEVEILANTRMGEDIERLNVIFNVWNNVDGSVFTSTMNRSGDWVLVSLDLTSNPTVLYCDNLGWESRTGLLEYLVVVEYTSIFGIVTCIWRSLS